MNQVDKVAVCSRSFSQNISLRNELLARYKYVTFNEAGVKLQGCDLIDFLAGHSKAITALESIDKYVLENLPELKVIGKYGVGLDMIDLNAMVKFGVELGWCQGVNKRAVAELTLAFAICLVRKIPQANKLLQIGEWKQIIGNQLSNKTFGIIGCGNIGKELVHLLKPFSCKILVHDVLFQQDFYSLHGIEAITLEKLLEQSDVVSLHLPLTADTRNFLSKEKLSLLRPSAVLINVSRGGLVDELAVKEMLMNNKLAAAAFDVFDQEPPTDHELLQLPNFFATPHIGGSAEEAIFAMGMAAIEGLDNHRLPINLI